jgi:HflK protein
LAGVIYHQLGSLAVLLNSMRLLWFERRLEGPRVDRVRATFSRVDRWMEKYLDLDEALHWVSHEWHRLLGAAALLLVVGWILSGFTQIGPSEKGVLLRFGRPLAVLDPGLTYCLPWPIDTVARIEPDRVRSVQVGFRAAGQGEPGGLAWDSPHGGPDAEELAEQALMITGENDLVEVQATVRYKVTAPEVFLFNVKDVDKILSAATESILRNLIASRHFVELLTSERERLQGLALRRLEQRCADYDLGIKVDGVALHDLHPPRKVVDSYYEVTRAMELRDKRINDAKADATLALRTAEAKYTAAALKAETAKARAIYEAQARWAEFQAWAAARKQLDFDQEWRLILGTIDAIQTGKSVPEACEDYADMRVKALALQAELINYRLFWVRFKQGIAERDVLLVDAENAAIRRQMLLLDLDQFRIPSFEPEKNKGQEGH